jgi:hypothetical protein
VQEQRVNEPITIVFNEDLYQRLGLVHKYRHKRQSAPFTDEQKAAADAEVAVAAEAISKRIDDMLFERLTK